jgi:hypothetical protein
VTAAVTARTGFLESRLAGGLERALLHIETVRWIIATACALADSQSCSRPEPRLRDLSNGGWCKNLIPESGPFYPGPLGGVEAGVVCVPTGEPGLGATG